MAATTLLGEENSPYAHLSFSTSLTTCLLVRHWIVPQGPDPDGHQTPLDQIRINNPLPRPADPLWSEYSSSQVATAWHHWWDLTISITMRRGSFQQTTTQDIDSRLIHLSELPDVQRWAAQGKRAFTTTRPRVLPPGMRRLLNSPLSIHVVAASGTLLVPLAADHVLATADLIADPDEYFRQLSAHIGNTP